MSELISETSLEPLTARSPAIPWMYTPRMAALLGPNPCDRRAVMMPVRVSPLPAVHTGISGRIEIDVAVRRGDRCIGTLEHDKYIVIFRQFSLPFELFQVEIPSPE